MNEVAQLVEGSGVDGSDLVLVDSQHFEVRLFVKGTGFDGGDPVVVEIQRL